MFGDRQHFTKRPVGTCGQKGYRFLGVTVIPGQHFTRIPVIGHFVVVPLVIDRDQAVEFANVFIKHVVFIIAAKLGNGFGDLAGILGRDVFPDIAIGHFCLCGERAIGIDGIAGMDEEVRVMLGDRGIGFHAAAILVNAPALPGGIA